MRPRHLLPSLHQSMGVQDIWMLGPLLHTCNDSAVMADDHAHSWHLLPSLQPDHGQTECLEVVPTPAHEDGFDTWPQSAVHVAEQPRQNAAWVQAAMLLPLPAMHVAWQGIELLAMPGHIAANPVKPSHCCTRVAWACTCTRSICFLPMCAIVWHSQKSKACLHAACSKYVC